MPARQLFSLWLQEAQKEWPHERITRLRNLAWLLVGIYQSQSVHLSRVASKIPSRALLLSVTRRLSRFLNNPAVRVWKWYRPIVQQLLAVIAQTVGEIRLIADGTKVGAGHQLLIIAVAFRRRALPIAWTWVRSSRGHSSAYKQLALLARVQAIIPPGVPVLLVGDSEFGAVEVLRQLDAWG